MRARALSLLALSSCTEPVPCAPGYGRLDGGACVELAAAEGPGPAETDLDTAAPDAPPAAADPYPAADIEADLVAALALGLPEPAALRAAWIASFEGANGWCPGTGYNFERGVEGCETEAGWAYSGQATYSESSGEGRLRWTLDADGTARRPDGTVLSVGGQYSVAVTPGEGEASVVEGRMLGTVDDPAGSGWVGRGESLDWSWEGTLAPTGPDVVIRGGWTLFGAPAVLFGDARFDACDGATGTVSVRRATDGRWADVTLDCAACGPAVVDGEAIGEVCVDLSGVAAGVARLGAL